MPDNIDDFLFSDEELTNSDESETTGRPKGKWRVLIVDDEKDIHEVTKLVFRDFEFENKSIDFLSALSGKEARDVINKNPDIALIILDVVMESDDAGLKFVQYIRDELKNKLVRIIIRTGQPGQAPEGKVTIDYDINDYKEKTELTQEKFFSAMIMAFRSYEALLHLTISKEETRVLLNATDRFIPHDFISLLKRKNITEIKLGEYVEVDMNILFLDIRSFTLLSENLTPVENFDFINSLLAEIEPAIVENQGFIDKYIGDAIMALFFSSTDSSVKAAIDILKVLETYNKKREAQNAKRVDLGISINNGKVILGTIGYHDRMDCTVISSAVNTAAKLEKMNKVLGTRILITGSVFDKLEHKEAFNYRRLGKMQITGKSQLVETFEIIDSDPEGVKQLKLKTKPLFEEAISNYEKNEFLKAADSLTRILNENQADSVSAYFLSQCDLHIQKKNP